MYFSWCVRKSFKDGGGQDSLNQGGEVGSQALQTQDPGRPHVLGVWVCVGGGGGEKAPITKEGRREVHDSIAAARYNKQLEQSWKCWQARQADRRVGLLERGGPGAVFRH